MTKVDLDIYMKNLFNDCYVVNCNYLKNSFYFCNSKSEIRKKKLNKLNNIIIENDENLHKDSKLFLELYYKKHDNEFIQYTLYFDIDAYKNILSVYKDLDDVEIYIKRYIVKYFDIAFFDLKIAHYKNPIDNASKIINVNFFESKKRFNYKVKTKKYYLNDNIDENMKMFQNKFVKTYK